MKWIGYLDVSLFWLAVLAVVTFSLHPSINIVFEDKAMLMENITNQGTVSGAIPCCGGFEQINHESGVKMVLTNGGIAESEQSNFCVLSEHGLYSVSEPNIVFIVY